MQVVCNNILVSLNNDGADYIRQDNVILNFKIQCYWYIQFLPVIYTEK